MAKLSLKSVAVIAAVGLFSMPSIANAESFSNLTKDGFSVSKMTKGKSGSLGWNVTKGDKKYFCLANISSVYIDKKKMYGFSSSGRAIEMDRKTFDDYIGGPDPKIPYWKDLQAGRVAPANVGSCLLAQ